MRASKNLISTEKKQEKAFLMGVAFDNKEDVHLSLNELARLAETAGLNVVGQDFQLIKTITPATLIGSGKVEELKEKIVEVEADIIIFDSELLGSQIKNLTEIFEIKVLDRIGIILDIFSIRAFSNESKLQIELALLKYTLPRLSGLSGTSGRFGSGGVGTRGPGETKLELDKRVIEKKIIKLEHELNKLKQQRFLKRKKRKFGDKKLVAIVGYTNVGKSTLLNTISKADVYDDDLLFATLDTTSRSVWLGNGMQIILTDTVGFINKLPHTLVDAFASTLEEVQNADLILHVVDVSNANFKTQIEVVNKTLKEIGATKIPIIKVYNKCDIADKNFDVTKNLKDNEIFISAKKNLNINKLKEKIFLFLTENQTD